MIVTGSMACYKNPANLLTDSVTPPQQEETNVGKSKMTVEESTKKKKNLKSGLNKDKAETILC